MSTQDLLDQEATAFDVLVQLAEHFKVELRPVNGGRDLQFAGRKRNIKALNKALVDAYTAPVVA